MQEKEERTEQCVISNISSRGLVSVAVYEAIEVPWVSLSILSLRPLLGKIRKC